MSDPRISIIVAMSENRVIGRDGDMPWRLSDDLRRFKKLTMGHTIIMGRKTFDSIGRMLPGRTTVVVTRDSEFELPQSDESGLVCHDLAAAFTSADSQELMVVGGGQIYAATIAAAERIYLTKVHTTIEDGDTFFPQVDWEDWKIVDEQRHSANHRNDFDYSFVTYERLPETIVD